MKQIILLLTILSIVSCNKNAENNNLEIDTLKNEDKKPKTELIIKYLKIKKIEKEKHPILSK